MPQLNFEPVVNKIGEDKYLISPKNDKTDVRCVICCNDVAKDIICAMYPEKVSRQSIAEMLALKYGGTVEEALTIVNSVVSKLAPSNKKQEENEV